MRSLVLAAVLISTVTLSARADDKSGQLPKAAPAALKAPFDAGQAKAAQEAWAKHLGKSSPMEKNSIGMELVLIPPGKFMMGDEKYIESQVEVTLTKPLYAGKTEVTQAQYESVMGKNPSYFSRTGKGKDAVKAFNTSECPVEQVSWYDAQAFCRKLSQKEGQTYGLLTEAEWEYACRAGTTTKFSTGVSLSSSGANFDDTKLNRTTSVGRYAPNAFGLYDMHGNVWEWCEDVYATELPGGIDPLATTGSSFRVFRGGSWGIGASGCRSAYRLGYSPDFRDYALGFRVAQVLGSQ